MESHGKVRSVPDMNLDPRVLVFRRTLSDMEEFDGMEVDAYVIIGTQYVLLLDTLICSNDLMQIIDAITPALFEKQILCINSHADWDHTWGNGYLSDKLESIPIIAHEHCRQRMCSPQAQQELENYRTRYPQLFNDVYLEPPSLTFRESFTIHDQALSIELLHAPGHCQDQIVAWLPEIRLLLAFDAAEQPIPCIEDEIRAPLMFSTLERLIALDANYVLCSHGKTTSPTLLQKNLDYLREIEQRSRLLLKQRKPTEEELEQASDLIGYPLTEAIAGFDGEIDRSYYTWAHEHNTRAILRWLMTE